LVYHLLLADYLLTDKRLLWYLVELVINETNEIQEHSEHKVTRVRREHNEQTVTIPRKVVAMLHTAGYFAMFWGIIQERQCTHRESWAACEATLKEYGLPHRYDSYESFKDGKYRQTHVNKNELTNLW